MIIYFLQKPISVEIKSNISTKYDQPLSITKSQKCFPLNLVPDYDNQSCIEDEKTVANTARRSSTSLISSSNLFGSSSNSDSLTSSNKSGRTEGSSVYFQVLRPNQIANVSSVESSQDDIIENMPMTDQLKYSRDKLQLAINSALHKRRCCLNNNLGTISPIYTDESDVYDDVADPTFVSEDQLTESCRRRFKLVPATSSSSDSEPEVEIEQKGRKRTQCLQKWKQNKAKQLRNLGEKYVSLSKTKKTMPSRCLKIPCEEKCHLKCFQNISTEERYKIFRNFWKLGDLGEQRAFIN
ncbi:uncharacterized protein LOC128200199 [Galleria mellonella]|uniref:Uncharacterized protein LOC128200199 n=1 Tax=Galleria mellonella TaxID=7137 RepID=A0ABM3MBG8_GALME|nr:uncharacterized protein LOC128200199 [Galleria mellonella]XP_052748776.1 uncharacterized protein LOC128200199 [Galleria mellonella]XP_052748777.1 uncharacterized protein LOC128200199 [Galleria mellonella]